MSNPPDSEPEIDPRRLEILGVAMEILREQGYAKTTMLAVAKRARASKETLYAWFGNKQRLFDEVIRAKADRMNRDLLAGLDGAPAVVLRRFGENLLTLLSSDDSIAINRAAIAEAPRDPAFGQALAAHGRQRTGALMIRYLEGQRDAGRLTFEDPARAFESFVGLLVGDAQVRMLTGAIPPLGAEEIAARAERATVLFLRLYGNS
ncbi:MAG TPA: TetR/AcrR family transcriptional regulator [Azospirillum sp.]|nr:TetR/AcrR family transcriptional regulator [Azospirillum sp.]